IREIVQFAAYVGCFLFVTVAIRRFRSYIRRAAVLLAIVIGIAAVYALWQAEVVGLVSDIVQTHRAQLISIATTSSLRTLVSTPAPVLLGDFLQNSGQVYGGLTPLFLFAGPAVVLLFSQQPLVWLISSSTLLYLAVMTISMLAIPYIYFTYFEILYTPVRNVVFFVYLFAGAAIYATVAGLARLDRTRLSLIAAGTLAGALALLGGLCLNRSAGGFVAPLMTAYGLAFLRLWAAPVHTTGIRASVATLLAVLGLVLLLPEREVVQPVGHVSVRWIAGLPETERASLERRFSLTAGEPHSNYSKDVNVWNYALIDIAQENIRALVSHPRVVDTNDIDRSRFTVSPPKYYREYLGVEHLAWLQYPGLPLFLSTTVFLWALGFAIPAVLASARGRGVVASLQQAIDEPFYRRVVPYTFFVIPFAILTARPTLSPLTTPSMPLESRASTPKALMARFPCVTTPRRPARFAEEEIVLPERTTCPPDRALVEWVQTHVPIEAVFAVDRWTPYRPQVFMPQQAVVFPTLDVSFLDEDRLFRDYYRVFEERVRRYRVQPFFNSVETPAERTAFVEALGVTHVLVNPPHHAELRAVLDALPEAFTLRYDQAQWAVYEVARTSGPAGAAAIDR
ncbi:MAG: hypothetical protein ACREMQ_15595, partial [Longimicrobiales bacterium]